MSAVIKANKEEVEKDLPFIQQQTFIDDAHVASRAAIFPPRLHLLRMESTQRESTRVRGLDAERRLPIPKIRNLWC
jgi:hypothetical protein